MMGVAQLVLVLKVGANELVEVWHFRELSSLPFQTFIVFADVAPPFLIHV
jgi:hypothetical protein